jgi:thiol-disulfide isomerase/thioredoxin
MRAIVIAGLLCCLLLIGVLALMSFLSAGSQGGSTATIPTVIGTQAKTVNTAPAAESPKVGPFQGMKAPDTAFVTVDGKTLRLSELRGRFVVIWFMAAWCPSCATVGPLIKDAVKGRGDVIVIVVDLWTRSVLKLAGLEGRPGVPPPEDAGVLSSFISQWGDKGWYLVLDETGELTKSWRIAYVDTTFVIDPEGNVVLRSDGPVTPPQLSAALSSSTGP